MSVFVVQQLLLQATEHLGEKKDVVTRTECTSTLTVHRNTTGSFKKTSSTAIKYTSFTLTFAKEEMQSLDAYLDLCNFT